LDLNSRAIQGVATCLDLVLQAGNSRPQQRHGTGNMRSGHRCAAGSRITTVAGIIARASVGSWSRDIRLCTIASISRNRAAAAKASNRVCSGVQSSNRIGRRIKRRSIGYRGTTGARVARSDYHLDTSSFLSFNSSLQLIADDATLGSGTTPGVSRYIRCLGRIAFVGRAAERVRRQEKFHALDVPGWCAIALVHVTATDPLRTGSHSNLVGAAIVANCRANGVTSMEEIVARLRRIIPAWVPHAVMNGIVPVLIVIRICSVPTAVVRLERVMCPTNPGISSCNNNSLAAKSERPDIGRMGISNPRLDRRRRSGLQRRFLDRAALRKIIVNNRVACHMRHVRTGSQHFSELAVSFHQNRVNDIERLMLDVAIAQQLQDRLLRALRFLQQGLIHEAPLFGFGWQMSGRA